MHVFGVMGAPQPRHEPCGMARVLPPMQAHRRVVRAICFAPTHTKVFTWWNSQTQVVCSRNNRGKGCRLARAI
eukprot:10339359-Lingulodinium_polyedra.AAC.1